MKLDFQLGSLKFSVGKALSPDSAAFLAGTDVDEADKGAKLVSPYAQSSWVYIAVTRLAEKVSSIPFRISRMDSAKARKVRALRNSADPKHRQFCRKALGENIVESGPAVDLFEQPHPTMSRQLFWEMVVTWLALRGEYFILPLDGADQPVDLSERKPKVASLITLPTELFWHMVQGYTLEAWRYTGSPLLTPIPSEVLLPGEVIHSRSPNPYLYWRGMSPLVVCAVAAGADYAASQYSKGYWLNNADTGMVVTTEQQLQPDQQQAILAALRERKRKAGTADRPLFLGGGAKIEKPTLSGMETTFIENRKMNRQEIAAIYKVPDSVMGFSEAKASALSGGASALDSEEVSWISNRITPLCNQIEASLAPVVTTFGEDLVGWFDIDGLPIMQDARRSRLDAAAKAFGIGVAFNDVNRAYDLGFPEYPTWGNTSYLPFNLQVAGQTEPAPSEQPEAAPNDEEGKSGPFKGLGKFLASVKTVCANPAQARKPNLEIIWNAHVATRRKSVKLFAGKVNTVLHKFRGKTLAKLAEIHLEKGGTFEKGMFETKSLIDLIFDQHDFGNELANQLTNPILNTLQLAGDELFREIGSDDPWLMPPAKAKEFLAKRKQAIQGVGGTVREQLNTSLNAGLDAGETHDQLSDRVRQVFTNLGKFESDRVARTEVNMAYNDARHEAMSDAGIEYKAWLSSHGPNVREAHAEAEEQYIDDPIPLEEPFEVGGDELMYPGDDSLGAALGNIINCQCIQLAAQKKEEDEKSITYLVFGVGEMKFLK